MNFLLYIIVAIIVYIFVIKLLVKYTKPEYFWTIYIVLFVLFAIIGLYKSNYSPISILYQPLILLLTYNVYTSRYKRQLTTKAIEHIYTILFGLNLVLYSIWFIN